MILKIEVPNPIVREYEGQTAPFGLQDKQGSLQAGEPTASGGLIFTCTVEVKSSGDNLDFSGVYVQGKKGERFLYLSWRNPINGTWIRRIKIMLSSIRPEQIEAARLHAVVDANSGARAVLLQPWTVI